jgi:DNA-binding transcriptional LysR family regulator
VERFLILIEYPTVKEAAKTLNIPHTTLSSQVLQLERDLGASLLVRARKGQRPLRLTRTGRRFVREARTALANLQAACGS